MTPELILGLASFFFVTSVTPGPNNLMLMASGANFGFRRTLPHMLGISGGTALMVMILGLGLGKVITASPVITTTLKVVAVVYFLWLAWKIAHAAAPGHGRAAGHPFSFLQAVAFQWINPKAWAMMLGAITFYAPPGGGIAAVAFVAAVGSTINLPSIAIWAWAGEVLRKWMADPQRLKVYNWTMAALLIASLVPVLWQ